MRRLRLFCLSVVALLGCSAGGQGTSLVVGTEGTGGASGGPGGNGTAGGGTSIMISADASASNVLSAHIEQDHVTIDVITLSCAGDCADVVAVPKGGFPPYAIMWEDGSTNPARQVCASAARAYEVSVTDRGSTSVEFKRAPQTVKVPLTARVLQCPSVGADAGTARADGGGEEACGPGFKPGVYEGTFKQAVGPLSGTDVISFMKSPGAGAQEIISGRLDNVLAATGGAASTTWGEGSTFYCSTQRLFLTGVEAGIVPLAYTYEATYDPANDTLQGRWASAAPPSPGVFPTSALDTGTWEAHWVRP